MRELWRSVSPEGRRAIGSERFKRYERVWRLSNPQHRRAGLGLIALVAAERPLQARQAEPLLQPTPLVLKDGRIASVSIHVVPFAPGRADLGGEAAARVAELTRAVGTDCFLTAQVIGHIDSSEVGQDDTLNAHRLARARADAVQASLIGGGLPAKAIASVWEMRAGR